MIIDIIIHIAIVFDGSRSLNKTKLKQSFLMNNYIKKLSFFTNNLIFLLKIIKIFDPKKIFVYFQKIFFCKILWS